MKALFLKDLYMAKSYMRSIFVMAAVFLLASVWAGDNVFMIVYPMVVACMIPTSLISYDEKFRWDKYCAVMPFTRAQMVSVKYLFALLSGLLFFVFTAIVQGFRLLPENGERYFSLLSMLLVIGLAGPALFLPIIFKLGSEKGRLAYYFEIGFICAVSLLLPYDRIMTAPVNAVPLPLLLVLVSIALFALSWLLSIQFYKKRSL